MRIVLDMQGAQSESRFRGIGRYAMSFAKAIVRNRGENEIILALSALLQDNIEFIRSSFDGLLPQENIRVWHAPGPVKERQAGNEWRREVAVRIREAFLASLKPDMVLILSLFEGFEDDAVTSIGVFDIDTPVSVTLHDLIPLLNARHYLDSKPAYKAYYLRKFEYLKKASLLLAVSESSRGEAIQYLRFPEDRVVNTSEAVDDCFRPISISREDKERLLRKYGISRPFVLYTGGIDSRKNIDGLIRAYAKLPKALRAAHCLVLVGKVSEGERERLSATARKCGLDVYELILTGYVNDEELIALYNLCKLMAFPSWHEGFGLPALEAMACGNVVIAANTSSLPELIGRKDALFDPYSDDAIAEKLERVLTDEEFRRELASHGLDRARLFSWDMTAKRAMAAFETFYARKAGQLVHLNPAGRRPKMAYISPLPPEKSGISDYSAELLPKLAHYYDIEVIIAQKKVSDSWVEANLPMRSAEWFRQNAFNYERLLYHIGNSPFHSHMFGLLRQYPGLVVLHDFFLSSVLAYEELAGNMPGIWKNALYWSHGYKALQSYFSKNGFDQTKMHYPCNLEILQNALGVIVHSEYSRHLAKTWYGEHAACDWGIIPLLRVIASDVDRFRARYQLDLDNEAFLVCCFGMLDPTKLNHRLLDAWLASSLSKDKRCFLVFVGENHGGEYGAQLLKTIKENGLKRHIRITGWVDKDIFRGYLQAADIAVQLRTLSRGEMSAAVLDCMNFGLPTIVNAHGSLAEIPKSAVWAIPDKFSDVELVSALEKLWQDRELRTKLSNVAREVIQTRHDPNKCAEQYAQTIETIYCRYPTGRHALAKTIAEMSFSIQTNSELMPVAEAMSISFPPKPMQRQMMVDVSVVARNDLRTGIERVVRAQLLELINTPPEGFRIEPVYLTDEGGKWHYRYARRYACLLLGIEQTGINDEPVDIAQGDIFYTPDFFRDGIVQASRAGLFSRWRALGISINFLVYDLLPVSMPEFFPEGENVRHVEWLCEIAGSADRLICISQSTAESLILWMNVNMRNRFRSMPIYAIHLGADVTSSAPSKGMPDDAQQILERLRSKPAFLMVGTIEPRKGHLQVIAAFERLWREGHQVNLVIVGKEGWKPLPQEHRRTIPKIVETLRHHKELGCHLFWLEGVSDEYLKNVYEASTCLIAASQGEGFGLPLIEAAQHKLPIIVRDIPVFREVAGENAFYFSGLEPEMLADSIKEWLSRFKEGKQPKSDNMRWITWEESVKRLKDILLGKVEPCGIITIDPIGAAPVHHRT